MLYKLLIAVCYEANRPCLHARKISPLAWAPLMLMLQILSEGYFYYGEIKKYKSEGKSQLGNEKY